MSGWPPSRTWTSPRSEEHTSELQSPCNLVCRLLLEKKKIAATALLVGGAVHLFDHAEILVDGPTVRYHLWTGDVFTIAPSPRRSALTCVHVRRCSHYTMPCTHTTSHFHSSGARRERCRGSSSRGPALDSLLHNVCPRRHAPLVSCCLTHTVFFFFFLIIRPPPRSPLFPYTPLFRSFVCCRIKNFGSVLLDDQESRIWIGDMCKNNNRRHDN